MEKSCFHHSRVPIFRLLRVRSCRAIEKALELSPEVGGKDFLMDEIIELITDIYIYLYVYTIESRGEEEQADAQR